VIDMLRISTLDLSNIEIADLCDCIDDRLERLHLLAVECTDKETLDYCIDTASDLRRLAAKLRQAMQ
jgi:hypothetical protein